MSDSSPNSPTNVAALLNDSISEDTLFEMLADSAGLGADEINKAAEGRTLFSRIWKRNKARICANAAVRAYMTDPNTADAVDITTTIVTVLATIKGINVLLVAALAVRMGLRQLCKGCE